MTKRMIKARQNDCKLLMTQFKPMAKQMFKNSRSRGSKVNLENKQFEKDHF